MTKIILWVTFLFNFSLSQSQAQYPPISPKWVFEPWVWEDHVNTEASTWNVINGYSSRGIPFGNINIDSPWEWPASPGDNGYNTFRFELKRYPNPKEFIKQLNEMGLHVSLWVTGVMSTDCPYYDTAKKYNYYINNGATTAFWRGSGRASHIDFFNPEAVKYWEGLMDSILDNFGVDGWKCDESDYEVGNSNSTYAGIKSKRQYSDAYYGEMYNYIRKKRGDQGMIYARPYCEQKNNPGYIFAPISVNTAGWVGDQENTWAGLQLALKNIFISAYLGYATVGFNIGGYTDTQNPQNKDLFVRWAQLGSMVPIMENGGITDNRHFPWLFDQNTVDIYRYFSKLHHQLVPYFYSYDILAHLTGKSIFRPIDGTRGYPDTTSWNGDWKYDLGDNIFIAAIYQDNTSRTITFPSNDSWINYWNESDIHQGGTTATLTYNLNQYPIFIRSGAIIPMHVDDSETGNGSASSRHYLTLLVYPSTSSALKYYTDSANVNEIKCDKNSGGINISFSKLTDSVIIRLKNNSEPESVRLSRNISLVKKYSFFDFENASSGWFQGQMNDSGNVYTWIKFSNPADTVYINNICNLNLYPLNYQLSSLNAGNGFYVDRTYVLTSVPDEYRGFNMIKTANDDKMKTGIDFHFNICSSADIYIAYDHSLAASTPSWISDNYTKVEGKQIIGTGYPPNDITFDIWKKTTTAIGYISFGINNGTGESSMYFVFYKIKSVTAAIKIFLQGSYNTTTHMMNANLRGLPGFPKTQPYGGAPWNYTGAETVLSIPSDIVDWVLVELRSTYNGAAIAKRAAFLKKDGTVCDIDGINPVSFSGTSSGNYYIIIKHRNHLAVMSKNSVSLPNSSAYVFTNSNTYGTNAMVSLETNVYGMWAGDVNGDTQVDADDRGITWNYRNQTGYLIQDVNLDITVDADDRGITWNNRNLVSNVPN